MGGDYSGDLQELHEGDTINREGRIGVIAEVYGSKPDGLGRSFPMYAIMWNDDPIHSIERGYLRVSLLKV